MARIAGIDLPKDKRIEIGLTYIYGIGRKSAQDILAQTGINPDTRVKDLTEADDFNQIDFAKIYCFGHITIHLNLSCSPYCSIGMNIAIILNHVCIFSRSQIHLTIQCSPHIRIGFRGEECIINDLSIPIYV